MLPSVRERSIQRAHIEFDLLNLAKYLRSDLMTGKNKALLHRKKIYSSLLRPVTRTFHASL
jgi:hypothetical protein